MVRVGAIVPQVGRSASREGIAEFCRRAEDLGIDSLWVADHIVMPESYESPYPFDREGTASFPAGTDYLEAFTTLGFLAGLGLQASLGTAVCVAPYRNRNLVVKQLATIERLSMSEVNFGVGVGWLQEEFAALGAEFRRRGRDTDALLELIHETRRSGGRVQAEIGAEGAGEAAEGALFLRPYPDERRTTIWIGGNSPAARRRAALLGDVWFPHIFGLAPETLARHVEEMREYEGLNPAQRAPRVAAIIPISRRLDAPSAGPPWVEGILAGSAQEAQGYLRELGDAGVVHMVFILGGKVSEQMASLERLMEQVVPGLS